ncbi:DUF6797 domain-containing protein [Roseimaritima sediminicola]|uniref:DUF6797 domain-containing protein n=1 Tax=Roseimaritima sediminicola TaxID=2662066 RepID=UPI0013871647|nr:DUF6797 domain-containing protein [Roseimaritima sediminicola]
MRCCYGLSVGLAGYVFLVAWLCLGDPVAAQVPRSLAGRLLVESPESLAAEAATTGDAARGAVLFHQPWMACTQCHAGPDRPHRLAPDLAVAAPHRSDVFLVQSILRPSLHIHPEFQLSSLVTTEGQVLMGLLEGDPESDHTLRLRDPASGQETTLDAEDVELVQVQPQSAMPDNLVDQLTNRTQFLDLVAYLREIRDGGPERAAELKPLASQIAARPLPDYEARVDHAGLIRSWDDASLRRGEAIYGRLCINCHGDLERPGSMPTSLRFGEGRFKNGSDPYAMYQTLSRGYGAMVAQSWMVPQQKYDVIHFIREHYLRQHNPDQFVPLGEDYLAGLPAGDTFGPEPDETHPWSQMDYGPNLMATLEIGDDSSNFAYKGNAIRLDHGPGGVSQGSHWIVYDTDTMRVAAAWRKDPEQDGRFIDYNGINFNGRHAIHPRIVGDVLFANPTGPGWASPDGDYEDRRVLGRDGRRYGPLPRDWAEYQGMYAHGPDTVMHYRVGEAEILETPSLRRLTADAAAPPIDVISRHLRLEPHERPLEMQVAFLGEDVHLQPLADQGDSGRASWVYAAPQHEETAAASAAERFDGNGHWVVPDASDWNLFDQDYSLVVRFRTEGDGTLIAKTADQAKWVPDGKSLFVRGGKLVFDIGWVGAIQSQRRVDDGRWHTAAVLFDSQAKRVTLVVDGQPQAERPLAPKNAVSDHVLRIGWTSENFPAQPAFEGRIQRIQFHRKRFAQPQWEALCRFQLPEQTVGETLRADYHFSDQAAEVRDRRDASTRFVRHLASAAGDTPPPLLVGLAGDTEGTRLHVARGRLRLSIAPHAKARRITIHHANPADLAAAKRVAEQSSSSDAPPPALAAKTAGGPRRWPQTVTTQTAVMFDQGPFAVDRLTYPEQNPWFCRMRLTGLDFLDDGASAVVCDWDGNVWRVDGLDRLSALETSPPKQSPLKQSPLEWTRIASGLFQPLGIKVIDGRVYVGCRDQICILHDLNGDGETDYYENFNNDHQVTEHFHEFAMGLQVDRDGNLYYAKSARHALKAVVPHHGTLLKVSPDGESTEIVATGFRAANGVCINPDGTFIVTDQEGHWNPKNRINWVRPGGFYGNMYGYHDVTDASDDAMQQPLCWITNAFDRSPAELLWVDSPGWGPLQGSLLNLSYGYGKVFIVPHEKRGDLVQGGMCELPIPQFPTGIHRGRFHPGDGQLYLCGMFAWAGTQHQNGGFYRLRYTGRPVILPKELNAAGTRIRLRFTDALAAADLRPEDFAIQTWRLKRTASYGSKHYDERRLQVASVRLESDGRTIVLEIPELQPTWGMEIRYRVQPRESQTPVEGVIHNTIHRL